MYQEKIRKNIEAKNDWYTASQKEAATRPGQLKVIRQRQAFILGVIHDLTGGKPVILDAGCGDGVILEALQDVREAELWGVDYNPLRLERAKKLVPTAKFKQASLEQLDFPAETFDLVVISQVLEHIEKEQPVLRELKRVLKKNGTLIIGVPNEGCLLAALRNKVLQRGILKSSDHIKFYTLPVLRNLLVQEGFQVTRSWTQGFFLPLTYLYDLLAGSTIGYGLMSLAGKILPSQCASFYLVCRKG